MNSQGRFNGLMKILVIIGVVFVVVLFALVLCYATSNKILCKRIKENTKVEIGEKSQQDLQEMNNKSLEEQITAEESEESEATNSKVPVENCELEITNKRLQKTATEKKNYKERFMEKHNDHYNLEELRKMRLEMFLYSRDSDRSKVNHDQALLALLKNTLQYSRHDSPSVEDANNLLVCLNNFLKIIDDAKSVLTNLGARYIYSAVIVLGNDFFHDRDFRGNLWKVLSNIDITIKKSYIRIYDGKYYSKTVIWRDNLLNDLSQEIYGIHMDLTGGDRAEFFLFSEQKDLLKELESYYDDGSSFAVCPHLYFPQHTRCQSENFETLRKTQPERYDNLLCRAIELIETPQSIFQCLNELTNPYVLAERCK